MRHEFYQTTIICMSLQYYYANFIESVLFACIYILQYNLQRADLNHFNLVERA